MPLRLSAAILAALAFVVPAPAADKPLKVYILAGQSNMQGQIGRASCRERV